MSKRQDLLLQEASSSQAADSTDLTPATPRTIRRVVNQRFMEQRPTSQNVQEPRSSSEGDGEDGLPTLRRVRMKRAEPVADRSGVRSVAGEVLNAGDEGLSEERKTIARSKRETSVISYYAQMSPKTEEVEPMPEIQFGEAIDYADANAIVRYSEVENAVVPYDGTEESRNAVVPYGRSTENAVVRYGEPTENAIVRYSEPTETAMVRFGESGETAVAPYQPNSAIELDRSNPVEGVGTSQQPSNVVNYYVVYNTVINKGTPDDESGNARANTTAGSTEHDSRSRSRGTSNDEPNSASSAPNVFNATTNYVNNGNINNGNINNTTNSQSNTWNNSGSTLPRDDPLGSRAGPNGSPDAASGPQATREASRKNTATQAGSAPRGDTASREKATAARGGMASRRGSHIGSRPSSDAIRKDALSRESTASRESVASRKDTPDTASRRDASSSRKDTASRHHTPSREGLTSRNGATVGSRSSSNSSRGVTTQEESFAGSSTNAPREAGPKNGTSASGSNEESDSSKTATPDPNFKNKSHPRDSFNAESMFTGIFGLQSETNTSSTTNTATNSSTETKAAHNNVQIESSSDARTVYHIDNSKPTVVNNYYVVPDSNAASSGAVHKRNGMAPSPFTTATGYSQPDAKQLTESGAAPTRNGMASSPLTNATGYSQPEMKQLTESGAAHTRNGMASSPLTNATGYSQPEMKQLTENGANGSRRFDANNAHDDGNPLTRGPNVASQFTANEPRPGSGKLTRDSKEHSSGSTSHASDSKGHSRSRSGPNAGLQQNPSSLSSTTQRASGSATKTAQNKEKLSKSGAVVQGSQSDSLTGSSTPYRGLQDDSLSGSSTSRHGTANNGFTGSSSGSNTRDGTTNDSSSEPDTSRNGTTSDGSSPSSTSRRDITDDSSSGSKGSFGGTKSESSTKDDKTRDKSKGGLFAYTSKKNKAAKESRPTRTVDNRRSLQGYDASDTRVPIGSDMTERRHSDPEPAMYDGNRGTRRRNAANRIKLGRLLKWLCLPFLLCLPCCGRLPCLRSRKSEDDTLPLTNPEEEKKRKKKEKKKRRRRCCIIILIIIILLLLGNMVALDVDRYGKDPQKKENTGSASSDGVDGADGTDGGSESSIKSVVCVTLLSAFALEKAQFPCGFCTGDPNAFTNVTEFCVLKDFWANAANRSALEADFGWMGNNPFCDWNGVTCNDEDRVTAIELEFPHSPSTLPSDVSKLKSLETLRIVGNGDLPRGPIPVDLFQLSSLKTLRLETTSIEGPLPDTLDKTSLESLELIDNQNLGSEIPPSIGSLSLTNLIIKQQRLTGDIPAFIGDSESLQSSLKQLDLSFNNFTGGTPGSLSQLSGLTTLILSNNQLSSEDLSFPESLSTLDLSFNSFSGAIPKPVTDLRNLSSLRLQNNGFSDRIPTAITRNPGLQELLLNNNDFTGAIPDELGDLRLQRLNLANNELTGAVPSSLCQSQYRLCDLSNNSLTTRQCSNCRL